MSSWIVRSMAQKRTIADIALLAGVSKATVSRVLNQKPDVDPETRERVLRVVKEVGFVPNLIASGLAGGRSRLLGILFPSFATAYVAEILHGVSDAIENTPYELLLYHLNDKAYENNKEEIINQILASRLTSGLLAIFPGQWTESVVHLHAQNHFPVVMIDDFEAPGPVPWVGIDNRAAALTAVQHLISLGRRRIAHVLGPMHHYCSRERYAGYCQALEEAGLPFYPELVYEGDLGHEHGRIAGERFFSLPEEQRPDAIFTANDLMAYGVLNAAEAYNVMIPDEVSLVGFDDMMSSKYVKPALSTIRQPFRDIGRHGLELLISLLSHASTPAEPAPFHMASSGTLEWMKEEYKPLHLELEAKLVVRSSCGQISSQSLTTS